MMNFILRDDKMMKCELVLCVSNVNRCCSHETFYFFLIPFWFLLIAVVKDA